MLAREGEGDGLRGHRRVHGIRGAGRGDIPIGHRGPDARMCRGVEFHSDPDAINFRIEGPTSPAIPRRRSRIQYGNRPSRIRYPEAHMPICSPLPFLVIPTPSSIYNPRALLVRSTAAMAQHYDFDASLFLHPSPPDPSLPAYHNDPPPSYYNTPPAYSSRPHDQKNPLLVSSFPDDGISFAPAPNQTSVQHPARDTCRSATRITIAHPYARLYAKKDGSKRRKIWNHVLEKQLFSPQELSV